MNFSYFIELLTIDAAKVGSLDPTLVSVMDRKNICSMVRGLAEQMPQSRTAKKCGTNLRHLFCLTSHDTGNAYLKIAYRFQLDPYPGLEEVQQNAPTLVAHSELTHHEDDQISTCNFKDSR